MRLVPWFAVALAACRPPEPAALVRARETYLAEATDDRVRLAPRAFAEARDALVAAEVAWAEAPRAPETWVLSVRADDLALAAAENARLAAQDAAERRRAAALADRQDRALAEARRRVAEADRARAEEEAGIRAALGDLGRDEPGGFVVPIGPELDRVIAALAGRGPLLVLARNDQESADTLRNRLVDAGCDPTLVVTRVAPDAADALAIVVLRPSRPPG